MPASNAYGDHRAWRRLRPDSRPQRQTRHRLHPARNDSGRGDLGRHRRPLDGRHPRPQGNQGRIGLRLALRRVVRPRLLCAVRILDAADSLADLRVPPRRVNEIVLGKRGDTADTALRLARYFGTSERFWLNLQVRPGWTGLGDAFAASDAHWLVHASSGQRHEETERASLTDTTRKPRHSSPTFSSASFTTSAASA